MGKMSQSHKFDEIMFQYALSEIGMLSHFVTYKQLFIYLCSFINNSKRVKFYHAIHVKINFHWTFILELKREGRWKFVNMI